MNKSWRCLCTLLGALVATLSLDRGLRAAAVGQFSKLKAVLAASPSTPLGWEYQKEAKEEKIETEDLTKQMGAQEMGKGLEDYNGFNSCKGKFPPTLQWGWAEACQHTKGGDETCEVFMASKMYHDEASFIEAAKRSTDLSYHPNLLRLKSRIVETVLEDRPLTILALGASTLNGRGCPVKHLRWIDALQNLSNFTGSPLPLRVINKARPATTIQTQWQSVLSPYKNDPTVDLIVIDYSVTAEDKTASQRSAMLLHTFVQGWKRPPAILFLENLSTYASIHLVKKTDACSFARNFGSTDPFYGAAKNLKLPLLSYPDIACHLPKLNRTSRSINGASYLHAYRDAPQGDFQHFGCGVHFILAHVIQLYLNKLLQDSCDPQEHCNGSLRDFCKAGFQSTLAQSKTETAVASELSPKEKCEINILSNLAFDGSSFPALTSNSSKWHLGADRPGKFGWIANEEPGILPPEPLQLSLAEYPNFLNLSAADIVFLLRLSTGTVFLDHLASYENIGSVTCRVEDLKGEVISPSLRINALWSHKYSISNRINISVSRIPKLQNGPNAAVRCRTEGKKFKIIGLSSC